VLLDIKCVTIICSISSKKKVIVFIFDILKTF